MAAKKSVDRICAVAVVIALVICAVFMNGEALGITAQARTMGYEDRLFDTSRVHTIDIVIDDWEAFLSTAQSEQYSVCSVVIDGEAFRNVGIRGKGNTSLSTVSSLGSDRYSFKIEFDQYDSSFSYHGLDKLSLNNLIQDNTMMKDYLTYQMMNEFGAPSPLCSYAYLTVNGEDWGLYLAVEAVEDSFLQRNYGKDYGELYKPDSMNMGGGRGNGMEFNMDDFMNSSGESNESSESGQNSAGGGFAMPGGMGGFDFSQIPGMSEDFDFSQIPENMEDFDTSQIPDMSEGFDFSQMGGFMGGFGMGSSSTKLQYVDDDPDSYSTIFDSAKTDITTADKTRLIASLKSLSEGTDLEQVVNVEDVIRYFVVHNYVVNSDSYTGSMIHNYYLYEEDGRLSMIPWDYNLAFGTFMGGSGSSSVNDDIDRPLSVTGSDRPMIDWILNNEAYSELYHQYFAEFLTTVDVQAIIADAYALIAPYVEKDPTKFCTYEEFEQGVQTLAAFCDLRSQSVEAQLAGEEANIDGSAINVSDMGTMGGMGGGMSFGPGDRGSRSEAPEEQPEDQPAMAQQRSADAVLTSLSAGKGGGFQMPFSGDMELPEGMEGMTFPEGMEGMTFPEGMEGMTFPEGMEGMTFPGMTQESESTEPAPDTETEPSGDSASAGQSGGRQPEQGGSFPGGSDWSGSMGGYTTQNNSWLMLGICVLVLAAGLLFAFKFKR